VPQIPPEIIEQVAAANDIVEVIGSYFPLKRAGATYKALCPFHRERSPSFTVNPQRQMFKCFGCGAGGSVFRFVMDYEHIEFVAAVRKLAERVNIKIPEAEMSAQDYQRADLRRRLLALHAEAAEFFHVQLMRGKSADSAREYLRKRGLSAEVAKGWKLGFAPDSWDALLNHAQQSGFSGEELAGSGLFSQRDEGAGLYDRFRGRIMFPICNDTGEVIAFSGRVLSAEQSPAKYVNSPETMLFTKGAVLFGLHKSKRALIDKKQAIVCEGQIDLITAFENGVQNVIAPQGTAFTERQARILKRYVDEVVLCFDADAAGDKAAERSLPQLLAQSLLVRCAEMPPGEDPDSLIRHQGGEAFAAVVARSKDFFEFQLERQARKPDFATPRGKIAAARKLAEFIALIPDAVTREAILNNTSSRLEIGADQLRTLLKGAADLRGSEEPVEVTETVRPVELDKTMEILCFAALLDSASRDWLRAQDYHAFLDDESEAGALLAKILDAEIDPANPVSVQVFVDALPTAERMALTQFAGVEVREGRIHRTVQRHLSTDYARTAAVVITLAKDAWVFVVRRDLQRRLTTVDARLRNPALAIDDYAELHQQRLALQQQLTALPAPQPPKMGD
jgi:DNA primase